MSIAPRSCLTIFSVIACTLFMSSCAKRVHYRGKAPEVTALSTLKVGKTSKNDVLKSIGSPSFETQFGPKVWYYVSKKEISKAFLKPRTVEKHTIALSFDKNDILAKVEDLDPHQPLIVPVQATTPSAVPEKSLLKQMFANFGRIAKRNEKKAK